MIIQKMHAIRAGLGVAWRHFCSSTLWLWQAARSVDYSDRTIYLWAGSAAAVLVIVAIGYRLANPLTVIESGDYEPFETAEEYEDFMEANPLLLEPAPTGHGFTKSSRISDNKVATYVIRLSERPLKPVMDTAYRESYLAYLERSQKDAKDWIRSLGLNPDEMHITWQPDPKTMREKLLGVSATKPIPNKSGSAGSSNNSIPTPPPTPTPASPTTTPTVSPTPTPSGDTAAPPPGRFPQ